MKIIDLLNKKANGEEVPKKFKFNGYNYQLKNGQYLDEENDSILSNIKYDLSNLNDEIEILDGPKKIEKIEMVGCNVRVPGLNNELFGTDTPLALEITIVKVNELIDEVNKLI